MKSFLLLAVFLLGLGLILRLELIVALAWLVAAAVGLTWWWKRQTGRAVVITRVATDQVFLGDTIQVELQVHNRSHLPLPWLTLREALPSEVAPDRQLNWLLSLQGREQVNLRYTARCKTRGRYLLGPLDGQTGVVVETLNERPDQRLNWSGRSCLTVFPRIVPLERLGLPSRLPLGTLKTSQPLLHDPSRLAGIREYRPGDDPRHLDWRNSARLNSLQVRQFDPTRQMPLALLLDLRLEDYQYARRVDCETAIAVAASLAFRANELRQPFGLFSNGFDPAFRSYQEAAEAEKSEPGPVMPPRQGGAWLFQVLDKLAGLQPRFEAEPLEHLTGRWTSQVDWGATLVFIGLEAGEGLAIEMLRLQKAGYSPLAIFTATPGKYYHKNRYTAAGLRNLGLKVFEVPNLQDLNASLTLKV